MKRHSSWILVAWMAGLAGLFGADGTWAPNSSGYWSDTTKWAGTIVASGTGSTAYITANINPDQTVTVNAPYTIGQIEISDGGVNGFTWTLAGANTLTLDNGGTAQIRALTPTTISALLGGSDNLLFVNGHHATVYANGSLPPRVRLSGANSFTGATTIRSGRVDVEASVTANINGPLGNASSAVQLGDAATPSGEHTVLYVTGNGTDMGRDVVVNNYGDRAVLGDAASAGNTLTWSGNITLHRDVDFSQHGIMTFNGAISGAGGLAKKDFNGSDNNAGSLTLPNANSYTGPTTVSRGNLVIRNAGALGNTSSTVLLGDLDTGAAHARLTLQSGVTLTRDIRVTTNGTSRVYLGNEGSTAPCEFAGAIQLDRTATLEAQDGGQDLTVSGVISGAGGIATRGDSASFLKLTGTNTFTGPVSLMHGHLDIWGSVLAGSNGPLGNASSEIIVGDAALGGNSPKLRFRTDATMDRDVRVTTAASDAETSIGSMGVVAVNLAGNLVVSNSLTQIEPLSLGGVIQLSGNISGPGTVEKAGAGGLLLTGDNRLHQGMLRLSGGTLVLGSDTALGTGKFRFHSYGTTLAATNGAHTFTNMIEWGRPVTFMGSDDLTFTGDVTDNANVALMPLVNNGSGLITFSGNVTQSNPANGYEIQSSGGSTGVVALLGPNNAWAGVTRIASGALRAIDGQGLPSTTLLRFWNGVFESRGTFHRSLGTAAGQVDMGSASGGFSAGGGNLTVDINNDGPNTLTWAATANFLANAREFRGGSYRADAKATFVDPIALGVADRIFRIYDNPDTTADKVAFSGNITGGANVEFDLYGGGTMVLEGSGNVVDGSVDLFVRSRLLVDGTLSSITANSSRQIYCWSGSRLGGRGTINGLRVIFTAGGGFDLTDGQAGTLTINSSSGSQNLEMDPASVHTFEVGATADRVVFNVSSGATRELEGALNIVGLPGIESGGTHVLFDYSAMSTALTTYGLTLGSYPTNLVSGAALTHNAVSKQVTLRVFPLPRGTLMLIR